MSTTSAVENTKRAPSGSFYIRHGKRLFDISASLLGLLVLSPLFVICAFLVKASSPGPVFFRQIRLGQHRKPFKIFKFRTMHSSEAEQSFYLTKKDDVRLTVVGKVLRGLKLDELPQLINVLRGEMSFVGPRARVPELLRFYQADPEIVALKPGITGLSTLCYRNQEAFLRTKGDDISREPWYEQKVFLEREYAHNVSFSLDVKLVFLTLALLYLPGSNQVQSKDVLAQKVSPSIVHSSVDLALIVAAVVASYWLRFEGEPSRFHLMQMGLLIMLVPFLRLAAGQACGIYQRMWRYTSLEDIMYLFFVFALPTALLLAIRLSTPQEGTVLHYLSAPLSVIALEYLGSSFLTASARIGRYLHYNTGQGYEPPTSEDFKRVLLVGAGSLGAALAAELQKQRNLVLHGFVDDDPTKRISRFHGVPVIGTLSELPQMVEQFHPTHVLVCSAKGDGYLRKRVEELLEDSKAQITITSAVDLR